MHNRLSHTLNVLRLSLDLAKNAITSNDARLLSELSSVIKNNASDIQDACTQLVKAYSALAKERDALAEQIKALENRLAEMTSHQNNLAGYVRVGNHQGGIVYLANAPEAATACPSEVCGLRSKESAH
ncbi:hypothetical protein [uncultured Pigmentiphaga sp.]|jgi:hypothetical protein|uniref:hypothetical protein n=1 Tax=uncultured Pigmentiphaga sp. TaxID=340361 RepID=UPI00261705A5|nr:hypothetical protein [uncultured Pigmentiphaga sp.]